jgi:hypothetical protein
MKHDQDLFSTMAALALPHPWDYRMSGAMIKLFHCHPWDATRVMVACLVAHRALDLTEHLPRAAHLRSLLPNTNVILVSFLILLSFAFISCPIILQVKHVSSHAICKCSCYTS